MLLKFSSLKLISHLCSSCQYKALQCSKVLLCLACFLHRVFIAKLSLSLLSNLCYESPAVYPSWHFVTSWLLTPLSVSSRRLRARGGQWPILNAPILKLRNPAWSQCEHTRLLIWWWKIDLTKCVGEKTTPKDQVSYFTRRQEESFSVKSYILWLAEELIPWNHRTFGSTESNIHHPTHLLWPQDGCVGLFCPEDLFLLCFSVLPSVSMS